MRDRRSNRSRSIWHVCKRMGKCMTGGVSVCVRLCVRVYVCARARACVCAKERDEQGVQRGEGGSEGASKKLCHLAMPMAFLLLRFT